MPNRTAGKYFLGDQLHLFHRQAGRHADPVDAQDQRVDAETALQDQDLLGHLGRRAEQETVVHQVLEIDAERVARGHHLVLAPVLIGFVFGFQGRLGEADRLGAVGATKTSRAIGSSSGNGLPQSSRARL